VSAPCGFVLKIWNIEKTQHVMQKNDLENANKKQLQKENAKKKNGNYKCTQNANTKTQCKTNLNQK
jgi:hypothetical protein